ANEAWTEFHGNDYVLFMRSSAAGSQYWAPNFQGDQTSDYAGYSSVIRDMISRGAGGFNLYGSDMGGFRTHPTKDLWNRWVVLSTFSPYMRSHGVVIHMPWKYGDAAIENFGDYYYLRKNLVPSIMSAAIDANKTSNPIVKGMMMAYPYYLSLKDIDNQYLFCDDFLVCAVDTADQHTLEVTLPQDNSWYNLFTYEMLKGGQTLTVEAPSNFMPIYLKDGAVKAINLPDSMTLMAEMHDEEDTEFSEHESLLITPPNKTRETVIYTKEGESEDFRTYKSTTETYVSAPESNTVFTVTNKEGSRREIVLALGVAAAEISCDGKKLTRLAQKPDYYNKEYGYYVDLAGMTTIYLPAGWKTLSVTKGQVGYTAYTFSEDNEVGMYHMFDNDATTTFTLSPTQDEWVMYLKDDAVQTIGRIDVKWAAGFLQSYDIEYSADSGLTWELLLPENEENCTVSAGGGGIDVIEFESVQANCIRLTKIKRGDVTAQAGIYELDIYAPNSFTPIIEDGDSNPDEFYDEEEFLPDDWEDTDNIGDDSQADDDGKKGGYTTIKRKKIIYPGFPVWALIAIIGGCVLVATGIVLFIILFVRKKKKKVAEEALKAEEAEMSDLPLQE
ncbi:MAG: discoidin domain-containing protein, partial [Clostridia bacterium]|nr:discoidin domain-containing protein [Clostridia bacterium]